MTTQPDPPPAKPSEPPATGLTEPVRYYLIGWDFAGKVFACLNNDSSLCLFDDLAEAESMFRAWKEMGTDGGVILPWPGVVNGRISDLPLSDRERKAKEALEAAAVELERLHRVHFDQFEGKIGEPDTAVIERARKALAALKGGSE